MYKILLVFWSMGELGILVSRFTDLQASINFTNCSIWFLAGFCHLAQLSNFEPESCKGDEEKSSFSFGKFIEDHFHNHLHFPKIEPLSECRN